MPLPLLSPSVHTPIGRYRLLRSLGSGGMGQVFLGEDLQPSGFRKLRAIKLVSLENQTLADRFLNEAVTGSWLEHPHIIQTLEYGTLTDDSTGTPYGYLVTEVVDGLDLRQLARALKRTGETLPTAAALSIAIAICDALEYAWDHARGPDGRPLHMIHRDIKPTNIMISRFGVVKLLDLGIVRATTNPNPTLAQVPTGTIPYMAPEQISNGVLDLRTDLFALGAVLFELVMGERLYPQAGAALAGAVSRADTSSRLGALAQRHPAIARALGPALAKDPGLRYPDHASLRKELLGVLTSLGGPTDLGALVRAHMPEEQPTEIGPRPRVEEGIAPDAASAEIELDTHDPDDALVSTLPGHPHAQRLPSGSVDTHPLDADPTVESSYQLQPWPRARWLSVVAVAGVTLLIFLLWAAS